MHLYAFIHFIHFFPAAECYDTVLEAINTHESRPDDKRIDSRLVIMKKFWPQFIQKIIVQNAFRKPVVFTPKILIYPINDE